MARRGSIGATARDRKRLGRDELNDCVLSQPEPPERVEGEPAFQVLAVCACNEDQPAHPGHLTARCDEHPVGVLLVQPSNVLRQRGIDLREVDEVCQGTTNTAGS